MFNEIKTSNTQITFADYSTTRSMKKGEAQAMANFKITGKVSIEKAIKCAIDKAIITFRDSQVKYAKANDMSDDEWLANFNGVEIEIDLDEVLTANERSADGTSAVRRAVKKADNSKLIAKLTAQGFSAEQAEKMLAAMLA